LLFTDLEPVFGGLGDPPRWERNESIARGLGFSDSGALGRIGVNNSDSVPTA
jgi:hypothetical protein